MFCRDKVRSTGPDDLISQVELSEQARALLVGMEERLDSTHQRLRQLYAEHSRLARDRFTDQRELAMELHRELREANQNLRQLAREYWLTQRRLLGGV